MKRLITTFAESQLGLRISYLRNFPRGTTPSNFADIAEFIRSSKDKSAILDIGANFGLISGRLLDAFAPPVELHAFEPSPAVFLKLSDLYRGNHRIHCHQMAMGEKPGTLQFEPRPDEPGLGRLADETTNRPTIPVEVTTVDAFLTRENIRLVPVMKTDTEGFEIAVLEGARQSLMQGLVKSILIEVSPGNGSSRHVPIRQVQDWLAPCHFSLFGLYDFGYRKTGETQYCNALFKHASIWPK